MGGYDDLKAPQVDFSSWKMQWRNFPTMTESVDVNKILVSEGRIVLIQDYILKLRLQKRCILGGGGGVIILK